MLDELLEVFDRDRKKNPNAPKQKGIRGFLSRLRDDDHDDRRYSSTSEQRPYRKDDDDDDDRYERSDPNQRRRRVREGFDFFVD